MHMGISTQGATSTIDEWRFAFYGEFIAFDWHRFNQRQKRRNSLACAIIGGLLTVVSVPLLNQFWSWLVRLVRIAKIGENNRPSLGNPERLF